MKGGRKFVVKGRGSEMINDGVEVVFSVSIYS